MSPAQKKVIDDHCNKEWAERFADRGPISSTKASRSSRPSRARTSTDLGPQLDLWKAAAVPVVKTWSDAVKKTGNDPDAILKEFRADLTKYNSGY